MKTSRNLWLLVLLALTVSTIVGLVLTGRAPNTAPRTAATGGTVVEALIPAIIINQQHLQTARSLATLAATPEERQLAGDAVRAADAEVDLAFASALRMTSEQQVAVTPQTAEIEQRIARLEATIQLDQDKAQQLTSAAKAAKESQPQALQEQTEVAAAELDLDQDALADAKQDLIRAGGDEHSRVQQLLDQHEAVEHANGAVQVPTVSAPQAVFASASLVGQWRNWRALGSKSAKLAAARQDALDAADALTQKHQALDQQVEAGQAQRQAPAAQAQTASAAVASLRRLSVDEKSLAEFDKRIQNLRSLAATYRQWIALAAAAERAAAHGMLWAVLAIVLTLLFASLINAFVERLFARLTLERKQRATLRAVIRFAVQVAAVVIILFVIFGMPSQLSTIVGLATAGLTVALKDFIVSFLGWFVLMGRNGIRVGDWVEINGVGGEVMEIGLLRTVVLETGNWTDAGHPTGRQVTFLNSFAVEGYYFNFTTSGQWLWDEITVLVQAGLDPYPLIEQLHAIVNKETASNALAANEEWQRVTRRYGMRSLSAAPAVNVKQTEHGVEVTVRYMTRASDRYELRSKLNHAALELLQHSKASSSAVAPAAS